MLVGSRGEFLTTKQAESKAGRRTIPTPSDIGYEAWGGGKGGVEVSEVDGDDLVETPLAPP